ncbi:MAG TPA: polyribonucleotide nucleotidyltransferase [Acidimicrobiia bacterium]|nr:polyribonucleotide nucleotidyltransferase [Acidimicrobiia bacterium]
MPEITVSGEVGGKQLTFSTGKLAGQADGAVVSTLGGTQILVTATATKKIREGIDFFPLTVDFEERMYAVGRIPGSFFRREGRPSEDAILTCRLIDRPLRPAFPDDYRCETHIVATSLSVDGENPFDVVALNGASAALSVSPIPFQGPIAGVRLALKKGDWVPFPTEDDLLESVFELVVAGRRNDSGEIDIMMVEAGSTPEGLRLIGDGDAPSDEATVTRGLEESKGYIGAVIDLISQLASQVEKKEVDWPKAVDYTDEVASRVAEVARPKLGSVITVADKAERKMAEEEALAATLGEMGLADDDAEGRAQASRAFKSTLKTMMRDRVIDEGVRLDGRGARDIRALSAEVGVIERAHGSGIFQRGETQVLNVTTLGMLKMEQMLDTLAPEESKRYMHHYNFPPFSTGEAGFMRGPKRREIGHGALAEKALLPVIPDADEFPYALRLVSEVLSSNGSTSMASVCSSTLSLMDAGVPILHPVAGIAMGLIHRDDKFIALTDILGAEDALGDMDFKVAGTADVITALQLDTKIQGLPSEVLAGALDQAKEARLKILEVMHQAIAEPRAEMNRYAPRIESIEIPKDKIGEVIGPKGAVIRELEAVTGATIEIDEADGKGMVRIASNDGEVLADAKERIMQIAFPPEAEVGEVYDGEVVNITKFGAFVNILPGRDGLLHISKLDGSKRVENVEDYLALGDKLKVRVGGLDRGKLSLDLVEALPGATLPEPREDGGNGGDRRDRDDRPRGDRGGDRGDRGDRGGRDNRGGGRDRGGRDNRGGGRDRDNRGDRGGQRNRYESGNRSESGNQAESGNRSESGNRADQGGDRRRVARSFEETFEDRG